MGHQVGPLECV